MDPRILLVEDDETTRRVLASVLLEAGYEVTAVGNGAAAIRMFDQTEVDVVVTDIRMREIDGIEVLTAARSRTCPPEVILLTGYGSLETAVAALRAGAFNYLLKPCDTLDLLACVHDALQRRQSEQRRIEAMRVIAQEFAQFQAAEQPAQRAQSLGETRKPAPPEEPDRYLRVGGLQLDSFRHSGLFDGQPMHLTPTEFTLLSCLAEQSGRVLSCPEIVRRTHGYTADENEAQILLRAHVRNLRRKLPPGYLVTVRGAGYMLADPHEASDIE